MKHILLALLVLTQVACKQGGSDGTIGTDLPALTPIDDTLPDEPIADVPTEEPEMPVEEPYYAVDCSTHPYVGTWASVDDPSIQVTFRPDCTGTDNYCGRTFKYNRLAEIPDYGTAIPTRELVNGMDDLACRPATGPSQAQKNLLIKDFGDGTHRILYFYTNPVATTRWVKVQ